jgi:hypothetical protein
MKLVTEYLQQAVQFERTAEEANDPTLKEQFLRQAHDYRRLAKKRALCSACHSRLRRP